MKTKDVLMILEDYKMLYPYLITGKDVEGLVGIKHLIEFLIKRGHFLYVIYPCNEKTTIKKAGLKIYPIFTPKLFLKIPLLKRIHQFFYLWRIGKRILKKHRSIGYIYSTGYSSIVSSILAERYSKKHITRLFGTFLSQLFWKFNIQNLKYLPKYILEILAWKMPTNWLVVTNDGTSGDLVKEKMKIKTNFLFLVNGVDKEKIEGIKKKFPDITDLRRSLNLSSEDFIITNVSRLSRWKRVDLVIKAFAQFARKIKNQSLKLILIGHKTGAYYDLINLVRKLGIKKQVSFLGNLPHERTLEYMYASDVLTSFYEVSNIGSVLLESLSLGKVILARNTGNTGKFIEHMKTGISLQEMKSEKSFLQNTVDILNFLYLHPEKIKEIGKNAYEYSKTNLWDWNERIEYEYKKIFLEDSESRMTVHS